MTISVGAGANRLGPYELHEELGRGGQGTVYRATDTRLGRPVALKVLERAGPVPPDVLARFKREAAAAARLDHPAICSVYEAGIENGIPFIAMRLIEGQTLARRLASAEQSLTSFVDLSAAPAEGIPGEAPRERAVPDRAAIHSELRLVSRLARALHVAHEAGIVHRDIKPANVTVTPSGDPVIMDFGLARDDASEQTLTQPGDFFGTPAYMSPEQLTRQTIRIDRRSDVWSLGVILYELVTRRRPFAAPTRESLYQAILAKEPEDPRRLNPSVSKDLAAIVETALQKDLDRRYQSAAALADDLDACVAERPVAARRVGPIGRVVRWSRREPAKAALLTLSIIALPVIAVLVASHLANRAKIEAAGAAELLQQKEEILAAASLDLFELDPARAIIRFEEALDLDPRCAEATAGIAMAHLKLDQAEDALAFLARRGESLVGRRAGALIRAAALASRGRTAEAESARRSAPDPRDSIDFYLEGARLIEEGHDGRKAAFPEAIRSLQSAIFLSGSPRALFFQQCAHAAGHARDAVTVSQVAAALDARWGGSATSAFWIGFGCLETGRVDDGIREFRRSIQLKPTASAWSNLAKALGKKGLVEDAIGAYRESVTLDPGHVDGWYELGVRLRETGRKPEALAAFQSAIKAKPGFARAHGGVGALLQDEGKLDEAIAKHREAVQLAPKDAAVHGLLALALRQKGFVDEAIAAARRSVELDPGDALSRHRLGKLLRSKGRLAEAEVEHREAVRIEPQFALGWFDLARVLESAGKFQGAIDAYRETIRLKPGLAEAHTNLGTVLADIGRYEEALGAQHEAVRLDSGLAAAQINLGILLKETGKFTEARAVFRTAHALTTTSSADRAKVEFHLEHLDELLRIDARLPGIEAGTDVVDDVADMLVAADVASFRRRWVLAAKLYGAAAAEQPSFRTELELLPLRGARAFVQAASGSGADSRGAEADRLRRQALEWLQPVLISARIRHEKGEQPLGLALLGRLLVDPFLAPVRDDDALNLLPSEEARSWREFWEAARKLMP